MTLAEQKPQEEVDFVLVGTGLAPLVAARILLTEGYRVVLINPDRDFFLEESEFGVDLELPSRFEEWGPEATRQVLSSGYPGAIQIWPNGASGYVDPHAPVVRSRSVFSLSSRGAYEGLTAAVRFPGVRTQGREAMVEDWRGDRLGWSCDLDLDRYRTGMNSFISERLERDLILGTSRWRWDDRILTVDDSIGSRRLKVRGATLVFYTPVIHKMIRSGVEHFRDQGSRLDSEHFGVDPNEKFHRFEQWSILSRDRLEPHWIGLKDQFLVWSEFEGIPEEVGFSKASNTSSLQEFKLEVLRECPAGRAQMSENLESMHRLFFETLGWDRLTLRQLKARHLTSGFLQRKWSEVVSGLWLVEGAEGYVPRMIQGLESGLRQNWELITQELA